MTASLQLFRREEQRVVLIRVNCLPWLAVGAHQSRIVESSTHHRWHARRSVEEIEERLLRDVVQVHV